jgi:hypothetical protein
LTYIKKRKFFCLKQVEEAYEKSEKNKKRGEKRKGQGQKCRTKEKQDKISLLNLFFSRNEY